MKRLILPLILILLLTGCAPQSPPAQIAATTLPVYDFTGRICEGTPLTVTRLVTEEVSCLHDYSLNVRQVKAAEAAETIVISGAGLEAFLEGLLVDGKLIDASLGIHLLPYTHSHHHDHDHEAVEADHETEEEVCSHEETEEEHGQKETTDDHHHHSEGDPHIWLSPENAIVMVRNISAGLTQRYPEYADIFSANTEALVAELEALAQYGQETLASLSCRELITFHDGFSYFAQSFDLTILEAVEEESGSEASARDLIHLIEEVEHHDLPAIFTEVSGSDSAASVIARETGAGCYALDMAMSGDSYFDAMYYNIQMIKEALQ